MKNNWFMKKISLFLIISCLISRTALPSAATPTQLTQLNSNKRNLKSNIGELLNCLKQDRSCDAEMKKTIKHVVAIVTVLGAITMSGISIYAAHQAGLLPNRELIAYKLFIRNTGYDEKYAEEFRKLETALQHDDIDALKEAIKNGALYYPDSKFALFIAQSRDAVFYLLANYPYNKDEMLNAQKSFSAGPGRVLTMSPLAHHKIMHTSRDVEKILVRFGAKEISKHHFGTD